MLSAVSDWISGLGPESSIATRATINMLVGGGLALCIRAVYRRYGSAPSNRDDFSNIFPMLTMITVVVIFVVKSSLALSLGLVGALSIVRFRAAIKSPEELIYLFFCIGVGLALGAEQRLLALLAVIVIIGFVLGRSVLPSHARRHNLVLTVIGDEKRFFDDSTSDVMDVLSHMTDQLTIQRVDVEDGEVRFRASVSIGSNEVKALMSRLRGELPQFQISYVNLDTLL